MRIFLNPQLKGEKRYLTEIVFAILCIILSAWLLGLRVGSAISLSEPLQVVTSGFEQESLVAIWNVINSEPAYVDRLKIPYQWAVYNWLYYATYAWFAKSIMSIFSVSDPWLPTLTRTLTLIGVLIATAGALRVFMLISAGARGPSTAIRNIALSFFITAGPLVGYWAVTTRPDMWAFGFEIWAIAIYWHYSDKRRFRALILFCVIAYLGWGFKQTTVTGIGALAVFFLLRHRWQELGALLGITIGLWSVTIFLGSDSYIGTLFLAGHRPENSLMHSVKILLAVLPKTVPLLLGLLAVTMTLLTNRELIKKVFDDDILFFGFCGLSIGAILAFVPGMQHGSAENYYYATAFFSAFIIVRTWTNIKLSNGFRDKILLSGLISGWAIQGILIGAVLFGFVGSTSVAKFHGYLLEQKACLDNLDRPLFVDDLYLSLPWMTPGNRAFVLFYGYHTDRADGIEHEEGGIGGLIAKGYFSTLAFLDDPKGEFDQVSLARYELDPARCGDLLIFRKK